MRSLPNRIMDLSTVRDAFDQVAKKQKLLTSKSQEVIDQAGLEIEQAFLNIQSDHDPTSTINHSLILADLRNKLYMNGRLNQLEGSWKDLNLNLSKYQKVLDKILNSDISKAYRDVESGTHIVNQIIIDHFYHEGLFDLADCLINESGESEAISLRLQFVKIYQIIEAMKSRNLEPALRWVSENRERLKDSGSDLELKLHKQQFVEILQTRNPEDALNYARTYLTPYASLYIDEIPKLMGCLLWAGKLEASPYAELMAPSHLEKLIGELIQEFYRILGQPLQSPLSVAVAAGAEGLPTLLKFANVISAKEQEWQAMKQLPVPVELSKEFQFHSVFVCPVSRDQGSQENPPMLLPCGHVLCKQSIHKLSKSSMRSFKCPYCPLDASVAQCRQLFF